MGKRLPIAIHAVGYEEFDPSYPPGYIYNCRLIWISNSSIKIDTGHIVLDDEEYTNLSITSQISMDISVSGKNGLDSGSEAVSTWYYVFVIYNPTTKEIAGVFSISDTTPTLPSGFTKKRRVGIVRNNLSGHFYNFFSGRNQQNLEYVWINESDTVLRVLAGGSATIYTTIDCSTLVPVTAKKIFVQIRCTRKIGYFRPTDSNVNVYNRVEVNACNMLCFPIISSASIDYRMTSGGGGGASYVDVLGYVE
jgi:hypothetical protein